MTSVLVKHVMYKLNLLRYYAITKIGLSWLNYSEFSLVKLCITKWVSLNNVKCGCQGLVKGAILCIRNLYFYFRYRESISTASQLTSPASQKSKDLNKVPLLLKDLASNLLLNKKEQLLDGIQIKHLYIYNSLFKT